MRDRLFPHGGRDMGHGISPTGLVHLCSAPKGRAPHLSPCWTGIQTPEPRQTSETTSRFAMSDICTTQILLPPCEVGARAGPSPVTPARSDIPVSDTQGCLGQHAPPLGALHPHPVTQTW